MISFRRLSIYRLRCKLFHLRKDIADDMLRTFEPVDCPDVHQLPSQGLQYLGLNDFSIAHGRCIPIGLVVENDAQHVTSFVTAVLDGQIDLES